MGLFTVQKVVHAGHHVERGEGGIEQASRNDDGHAALHRGADLRAHDHGHHGKDGGERGHEDGAQARTARGHQRAALGQAAYTQLVDVIDEHDAVVHDGAHEHREAHQRHHRDLLVGQPQAQEAACEGQGHREQDNEGREQALELSHHNQVDQNEAQDKQKHHLLEHRVDVLKLTIGAQRIAFGQVDGIELVLQVARKERVVVAILNVGGHRDGALTVKVVHRVGGHRFLNRRELLELVGLGARGAVGFRLVDLDLGVEQVFLSDLARLVHDLNVNVGVVHGDLRRRGGGAHLRGDVLIQLRHGVAGLGELVAVDHKVNLLAGVFHAVLDLGIALNLTHGVHHLLGQLHQLVGVGARDHDGQAAAHHRGHGTVGGAGIDIQARHVRADLAQLLADLGHLIVGGDLVGVGLRVEGEHADVLLVGIGGSRGHHAHLGGAVHASHQGQAVDFHGLFHDLVGHLVGVGLGGLIVERDGNGDGLGAHGGDHGDAHVHHADNRNHQKHGGHAQRKQLVFERETQAPAVKILHLLEGAVGLGHVALEHEGAYRGHQRQGHHKGSAQNVGDGEREGHEHLVDHARGEDHGQEHADGR